MAKQGEGDPRWRVTQRPDGRNVNGWHWEDKNVSAWAHARIKDLLTPLHCTAGDGVTRVAVEAVDSVDGDATLYNRKGVLKVLYDLKVCGKWSTRHEEKDERTHGEFKFELFDEDPEVSVGVDAKSRAVHEYRKAFADKVGPQIREQCRVFIKEMHAGAGHAVDGLALPAARKRLSELKVTDFARSGAAAAASKGATATAGAGKAGAGKAGTGKAGATLVLKDEFACRAADMFLALTERGRLEAITRARAVSEAVVGGRFEVLNGAARGEYTRLEEGRCVGMRWKLKTWGEAAAAGEAVVRLETTEEGKCAVEVTILGVPEGEQGSTEGFWRVQVFQAMKVVMGWGSASQFL
ncbi:unnamed protein product [Chondrus crispus]|uniref:Activator of Hsp90 ATPase AHSA1-like N-terminal domain-containing protein n=1 Tax=Chondrus crispus TaxID=2769 RepID=R7QH33_CHOCR|nr:unnamed protein product [Chondrus crispus]CDF37832.1 unnamed protein product [Chondrus crispus]|eukprot:XP_005717703.1 unnamed protein product [Chondrus crispus]